MSGIEQLQYLSWLLYLVIFALVLARTIRRPTPAHVDMTLFFGAVAIVIITTTLASKLHVTLPAVVVDAVLPAALLAMGYLLLRLVHDFSEVPPLLIRAVEVGMAASIAAILFIPAPLPGLLVAAILAYLITVIAYDAWAFARQARRTHGVTRRRMQAAALGSLCVGLSLSISGLGISFPALNAVWDELGAFFGLLSGAFYFVGFAPPTWLRRAWQEPEVRAFLSRAVHASSLADIRDIVRELEAGVAHAFGAPTARLPLFDPDRQVLEFVSDPDRVVAADLSNSWVQQRPHLFWDYASAGPAA